MKKFLPFLIVVILVLSGLGAVAITLDKVEYKTSTCLLDDELDQSQTEFETGIPIGNFQVPGEPRYNWTVAQSYTPGKEIQTRIQLLLSRNTIPPTIYPLVMCIRESLTGENMGMLSIEPEEVPEFPDLLWIEFDFDDMLVTVGQTYYIVCYTTNETDNGYVWGVNGSNLYPNGQVYFSFDDGATWASDPPADTADMCFKTYGRDNQPPNAPSIDGETSGKAGKEYEYTFNATDPEEDDISYFVDWGDDTTTGWTDFVASGEEVALTHTWDEQGPYTIRAKAKDTFDAESEWGELEIEMPRNKAFNFNLDLLEWLFERFPNAFPILRNLLGP